MSRKLEISPVGALAGALCGALAVLATPAPAGEGRVELGADGAALTDGLGSWKGVSGLLSYVVSPGERLGLELGLANRFDEQGLSATATWQHDYTDNSYQVFSLTGSTAALFWPSAGISTEFFHKVGAERNWVLGGGAGFNGYRTGNTDAFGVLEAIRYLPAGWVVEAGLRVNVSQPGSVTAPRGFAALSWIPAAGHEYVLKVDGGDEAYQVVGPDQVQARFQSIGVAGEAFVPLNSTGSFQIHLRAERYMNPFYDRWSGYAGFSLGFASGAKDAGT